MPLETCEYCLITSSFISDSTGKLFKLAYCMHDQVVGLPCPYPARYCAVRHQEDTVMKKDIKMDYTIVCNEKEWLK